MCNNIVESQYMSLPIQFSCYSVAFNYIIISVELALYLSSCSGLQWNGFLYLMALQVCDICSACLLSNDHLAFVIWHFSFIYLYFFFPEHIKKAAFWGLGKKNTLSYFMYFRRFCATRIWQGLVNLSCCYK